MPKVGLAIHAPKTGPLLFPCCATVTASERRAGDFGGSSIARTECWSLERVRTVGIHAKSNRLRKRQPVCLQNRSRGAQVTRAGGVSTRSTRPVPTPCEAPLQLFCCVSHG